MARPTSYAALLRAVNLGNVNKVPMAQLRTAWDAIDAVSDTATYIQSGNAVVRSTLPRARLRVALEAVLDDEFGVANPVVLRTRTELAAAIDRCPYPTDEPKKLMFGFATARPAEATLNALGNLDDIAAKPERLAIIGADVYYWLPAGQGRSKLAGFPLERKLGVAITTRNLNTVRKLLGMLDELNAKPDPKAT